MNSNIPIITLTTDFGLADHYVAVIKANLLKQIPQAQIVDITHLVPPHDIVKAAFLLKNAFQSFPNNTIHVVSVNNDRSGESSLLLARVEDQFFVLPDNGILSLLFSQELDQVYRIPKISGEQNTIQNIYATVCRHLVEEGQLEDIGQQVKEFEQRITLKPVISTSQIRGLVIHIDHYENAIVNISKSLFEEVGHGRPFEIYFKRHDPIRLISQHYQSVPVGDTLCLFNSADQLEIAISMGKAASMLGLNVDDMIQIDFKNAVLEEE
ncbi:MAG: SAM-dependent chlorinase/fluorinase [Bacteroidota bacterium]